MRPVDQQREAGKRVQNASDALYCYNMSSQRQVGPIKKVEVTQQLMDGADMILYVTFDKTTLKHMGHATTEQTCHM